MKAGYPKILACPYTLEDRDGIDIDLLNVQNAAALLIPDARLHWQKKFDQIRCQKWMYVSSTVNTAHESDGTVGGRLRDLYYYGYEWKQISGNEAIPFIFRSELWWERVDLIVSPYTRAFDMTFLDCWFKDIGWAVGNNPEVHGPWKEHLIRMKRTARKWGNRIIINGYPHGSRRRLSGRMIENVPNKPSWIDLLFGGAGIYDAAHNKEYMHPRTIIISEWHSQYRRVCLALSMILGCWFAPKGNWIIPVLEDPEEDAGGWWPVSDGFERSRDLRVWSKAFRHWKTGHEFTVSVTFSPDFRSAEATLPFETTLM